MDQLHSRPHPIVLHISIGTTLLLSVLAMLIGIAIMFAGWNQQSEPQRSPGKRLPFIGSQDISKGDSRTMEATYGPVNHSALNEAKQGIFANMRARRAAKTQANTQRVVYVSQPVTYYPMVNTVSHSVPACIPCQPQLSTPYISPQPQVRTPDFQPTNSPWVVMPANALNASVQPLNNCTGPGCLDIKPSAPPTAQTLLEFNYGPLNKSALQQVKQSASDATDSAIDPTSADEQWLQAFSDYITQPERAHLPESSPGPNHFRHFGQFAIVPSI